ncbi:MAG: hypothetical protein C0417_13160 [Chlorobiaceae bacterium]|nr:hypothetical protein [Chlorobiaceae bacterium]
MTGKENTVKDVLQFPDEIRRSRNDSSVYLFYKLEHSGRWICVVVKRMNNNGFIITAYPTDKIKEGDKIWNK